MLIQLKIQLLQKTSQSLKGDLIIYLEDKKWAAVNHWHHAEREEQNPKKGVGFK